MIRGWRSPTGRFSRSSEAPVALAWPANSGFVFACLPRIALGPKLGKHAAIFDLPQPDDGARPTAPWAVAGRRASGRRLAPAAQLGIVVGSRGCGMCFGCVIVDRGGSLRAQVSGSGVELERGDGEGAMRAEELHAAFNALDSVGFHCLDCSPLGVQARTRWLGGEGNGIAIASYLGWGQLPGFSTPSSQNQIDRRPGLPGMGQPGRLSQRKNLAGETPPHVPTRTSPDTRLILPGGCISSGPRAGGRAAGL